MLLFFFLLFLTPCANTRGWNIQQNNNNNNKKCVGCSTLHLPSHAILFNTRSRSLSLSLSCIFYIQVVFQKSVGKKKKEKGWVELFFSRYTHVQRLLKKHEPTFFFFSLSLFLFWRAGFKSTNPHGCAHGALLFCFFFCVCVCAHMMICFFFSGADFVD